MKSTRLIFFVALLGFVCVILTNGLFRKSSDERLRAELYMLDKIKNGVSVHLDRGGQFPSSWIILSNSVNWGLVVGICDYNKLPPPPEAYTLLSQSVTGNYHFGAVFLVRSKPYKRSGNDLGRWALAASSNQVKRIWIPERYLAPEIRSQLTN